MQSDTKFYISIGYSKSSVSILHNYEVWSLELIVSEELTNGQISDKIICKNYWMNIVCI